MCSVPTTFQSSAVHHLNKVHDLKKLSEKIALRKI
jgi:hypothetical protein